ncbi:uncharacterized protein LOC133310779 [Gastrolobium bilobum]|uniref:uncharacterized protein LOC133310779 n=1 Tax=Gastrolobium bilobum TaxID=150636 RepID=UPI002AB270B0|nr:uncharacterized protein LOC133310779 [Gastrolobium bilobum]
MDHVIRFLKGLNEQFNGVKSQIMLIDPLPEVNKAFAHYSDNKNAPYGRGKWRPSNGRGNGNKFCTNCKKTNHTIETCYFKHGFPPGYKPRSQYSAANVTLRLRGLLQSLSAKENNVSHSANLVQAFSAKKYTKETIGLAEEREGLYVLVTKIMKQNPSAFDSHSISQHSSSNNASYCNNSSLENNGSVLWHYRLGHLSHSVMKTMYKKFPFLSMKDDSPCDICHFAKQSKLPFPSSTTTTEKPLQVLHADIWGPYSTPSLHGHKYFLTLVDDDNCYT